MAQYIYGKNVITQRLKDGKRVKQLYLFENGSFNEIESLAKKQGVPIRYCSKKELNRLEDGVHQGIIAEIEEYRFYSIEEILQAIPEGKTPLLVLLDGLEDPHNLGAILRTCDAIGVDGVIIGKHRSVSLNATVAKVSTGAIETVKVAQVTNLTMTIKELKKQNFWVCGTGFEQATDYRKIDYTMPLLLVIGAEGTGISRLVKENCDFLVKLPMVGSVQSLNASVATGILLYQIYNQRNPI